VRALTKLDTLASRTQCEHKRTDLDTLTSRPQCNSKRRESDTHSVIKRGYPKCEQKRIPTVRKRRPTVRAMLPKSIIFP